MFQILEKERERERENNNQLETTILNHFFFFENFNGDSRNDGLKDWTLGYSLEKLFNGTYFTNTLDIIYCKTIIKMTGKL